jgi:hypothetical protein
MENLHYMTHKSVEPSVEVLDNKILNMNSLIKTAVLVRNSLSLSVRSRLISTDYGSRKLCRHSDLN